MLATRLLYIIEQRLTALASEMGRTKTALATQAILQCIEDLGNYYYAEDCAQ